MTTRTDRQYDIVILGGGLAGLTLALQLRQARPETDIVVIEKNQHPVREAAHKVGESSVEIGTHYFTKVLGLEKMIEAEQLPKLGLRFFYTAGDNQDIARRLEVGPSKFPPAPSYQLDRGRYENALGREIQKLGVTFLDAAKVEKIDLGPERHSVTLVRDGKEQTVQGRWLVDASGRAALLKRQLGLAKKDNHDVNAAWFRLGDRVNVDDWSDNPAWQARVPERNRWLSTNHLMGRGYWVWLIPLSSGSTSIGIVADNGLHPFDQVNTFDRAMDWLRRHEPQCAAAIEAKRELLQDFRVLKHFSYGCERVYSPERWCLTGEAGAFLDPFYSPGSDFISISNGYVGDLITRDLGGEDVRRRTEQYNRTYLRRFETNLRIYEGQYPIWGNPEVMTAKEVWDFVTYWGVLALLYFNDKWTDLDFMATITSDLFRYDKLDIRVQTFFSEWDNLERREFRDAFIDYAKMDWFYNLNLALTQKLSDDELRMRISENVDLFEVVATALFRKAGRLVPGFPESASVDPYAMTLDPDRWQADGVFSNTGKVASNPALTQEIEAMWLELEKGGAATDEHRTAVAPSAPSLRRPV